ncbi:TAXI family TRAP transporter solute-binding subunit [Arthrobacter bambusae]|uniref:TAXI family TRAP transporter solute-binding subunit n=1 Tax=Arthrobacter bambusae TaxID=1338426 RepID=UPI002786FAA7|nr:TAXI family TRAP transporter solute-binding subunit [Arthrobacter bambusae]MDQ0031896.1 TRAP transporter TAXI family solute receptor [Arthrobacter bambusae]MDQ0100075.1 TRAP transporter TAXI family solute receptor [Arthrobacter bambusae]
MADAPNVPALPSAVRKGWTCPPRRSVMKAGLAMGLAGLFLPLTSCMAYERPSSLTVAGGESGGFYLEFSTLLADLLQHEGIAEKAQPLTTGGSLDNIRRLLDGEASFAVALADTAAQQASTNAGRIVALGKVYENYVHCIVRQDSGIRSFGELAGKTAAVGEAGSGTSLTAHRIIAAAGLSADAPTSAGQTLKEVNLGLNQGLAALRGGSVDALFWSGGVPTSAVTAMNKDARLSLIDLSGQIPATRSRFGAFYDRVLVPRNSYQDIPAVWTVGVANLLLCRDDLPGPVVKKTVELLVGHAQDLIPKTSMGVQFLSPETLISTVGVPLHPAAAAAYRELHG